MNDDGDDNKYKRTLGDALMRSHASPYNTVGELLENSSVLIAYMSTAVNPAPNRITVKLLVCLVVRNTCI